MTKIKFDKIVESIKKCKYNVNINLLGGEPTLHPNLEYFINALHKLKNVHFIEIATNGYKDISYLNNYNKLRIYLTYHQSYNYEYQFLENIKNLKNNINSVSLMKEKDFECSSLFKKIKEIDKNIEVQINPVIINGKKYHYDLSQEEKILVKDKSESFVLNGKDIDVSDSYDFYGWKCEASVFDISTNGDIEPACKLSKNHMFKNNIFNNPDFFITYKLNSKICLSNFCSSCGIKQIKYKDEDFNT
jgi:organic radical activating enzyme